MANGSEPTPRHCPHRSPRLGRELALALVFKVVLLTILWLALFRPDPHRSRPSVEELFARSPASSTQLENYNGIR
ncbi:cytochrome oxidase putative small subunit CydP [Candidatus Methylocalor cossyra]|uniref:Uncharacterized protein n=1 Tax=Candidatus Methylocalor cossyra TaxID=3108543 RepID=A0ABM9NHT0_9GAMM